MNPVQFPIHLSWDHSGSSVDIIAYRIIGVADGYTQFFKGREF